MEPGVVTLFKLVGLLGVVLSLIPLVFLLSPGEKGEPKEPLAKID